MRISLFNPEFNYNPVYHYINKDALDYQTTYEFLSKPINTIQEYRQWVKAWKIVYKNLSLILREHKKARKLAYFNKTIIDYNISKEVLDSRLSKWHTSLYEQWLIENVFNEIPHLKQLATDLLRLRAENKERYPSLIKEDSLV